ncbi:hypothetical protein [Methanochimaera problematica]|nr:hypothetical protein [Methanoplanus sp. FWC-SCC4]
MRERSHEKGKNYQKKVKKWLYGRPFLGYESDVFGDAYDVSNYATCIGEMGYDISMCLKKNEEAKKILYIECKYRDELSGSINTDFHGFLLNSYNAFSSAKSDQADAAQFCFISNIPPTKLHQFFKDSQSYTIEQFKKKGIEFDEQKFRRFVDRIHVLILSKTILGLE